MKISHKLSLGFLLVTLMIGVAGQISFQLSGEVHELRTIVLPMEQTLHELDVEMWEAGHEAESYRLTAHPRNAAGFRTHADAVEAALALFRGQTRGTGSGSRMCDSFQTGWDAARVLAQRIMRSTEQQTLAEQLFRSNIAKLDESLGVTAVPMPGADASPNALAAHELRDAVHGFVDLVQQSLYMLSPGSEPTAAQRAATANVETAIGTTEKLRHERGTSSATSDQTLAAVWATNWPQAVEEARSAIRLRDERSRMYFPMQQALDAADAVIDDQMRPAVQAQLIRADRAADGSRWHAVIVVLVCIIFSLGICTLVSRDIGAGVTRTIAFAQCLAAGDLAARLPGGRRDEFGALSEALNQTAENLARSRDGLRREIKARSNVLTALQESERRFGQIAENIREVFWIITAETCEILYVSPAYEAITGRSCAAAYTEMGSSWLDGILEEDKARVATALASSAGGTPREIEFRITHHVTGEIRWVRSRCFPLAEKAGVVTRLCGITEDVTDRKLTDQATEELNKRLRELSHQGGMAEVATNVLHNVGNVLNSVNVAIEVATRTTSQIKVGGLRKAATLLGEHAGDLANFLTTHPQGARLPAFLAQLAEHFEKEQTLLLAELSGLRTHIEHINEIVAMQQAYAISGGLIETLPISEVIDDAIRMNSAALDRHGAYVVREFAEDLPPVPLDRHKVLQILINFIRNAKYAMDEANSADKRLVLRTARVGGDQIAISVIDTGVGILPEHVSRLFEHGFTTRKNGHGFGLHSSALAAKELGGCIKVESLGLNLGATFSLVLPLTY